MASPKHSAGWLKDQGRALAWGLGAALLVGLLSTTRLFWGFEERAIGLAMELSSRPREACPLVVVELRGEDYARLGGRISREHFARLVRGLSAAGAGVIGFDIAFSTPDFKGPEAEAAFEAALAAHGRAVTGISSLEGAFDPAAPPLPEAWTLPPGPSPAARVARFERPYGRYGELTRLGTFFLGKGESGVLRTVFPLVEAGRQRVPTLALSMYLAASGRRLDEVVQEPDRLRLPALTIPLSPRGDLPYAWKERRYLTTSLSPLLAELEPGTGAPSPALAAQLRGRHVLVGGAWDVVADTGPVATGALRPLVHAHAQFFCDLLEGRPMRDAPAWAGLFAALAAGLLLSLAAVGLSSLRSLAALAALAAAVGWAVEFAMGRGLYLGPLSPLLGGLLGWAGATAGRLQARESERRVLKDAFGAYVDPSMMEKIIASPAELLALSGGKKTLSVLFSDLVGFTALTNALAPETLVTLLREYTEAMTRTVVGHGGRVDKIMGDGMLAVFGDPVELPDHAGAAVLAALAMRDQLALLNQRWKGSGLPPLQCRLGVATGEVFVGNIGSRQSKLEYTVLGATVNLASRLEGRAPPGCVLVSRATCDRVVAAFELVAAPPLVLKGFEGPQEAWLVMGLKPDNAALRRHARVEVTAPVKLKAQGQAWVDASATNVSAGGLFVVSSLDVPAGTDLELAVPGAQGLAQVFKARVRWRGAGGSLPGVGLGLEVFGGHQHLEALFRLERRRKA